MPLNLKFVENFVNDHKEIMQDLTLLRHGRYNVLLKLKEHIDISLKEYETFQSTIESITKDIENATTSYERLKEYHILAEKSIEDFFLREDNVVDVHDLFRITRDAITRRVLILVEEELKKEGFGPPPSDYVWIGLGSEGRDEQTIMTDQDNLLVFDDKKNINVSEALRKKAIKSDIKDSTEDILSYYFREFSTRAVERLNQVGFEKCKGNVMPTNPKWFGSISLWKKKINNTLTNDYKEFELLDIIILTDARLLKGEKRLFDELMEHFFGFITHNKHIMREFTKTAVIMPTALTFFGNFKTEKEGEFKGKFNIKLTGWAPLILSVRMLALANKIYETNTLKRIKILKDAGVIKKEMYNDLVDAYLTFVRIRLLNQISIRNSGNGELITNTNYIDPNVLSPEEKEKVRRSMKTVEALQKYIQDLLLFGQSL
ncbi:MAG TPA: putative nucleotidyltransferase substrate binding domain-containing protein [Syntrophorhabdaceae bacterium]|nr:putative nucleotidyltransferase substrate binding domain-containing protein [Syntrophorhabdaceae bacterium]